MKGVWNAPATASGRTRAPAGGSAASFVQRVERAGGDDLAGAVAVGRGEARGLDAGRTSSGSPPSTADMPVGVSAQAAAISAPRHGGEGDRPSAGVSTPDHRGGGELADAVPGDDASAAPSSSELRPAAISAARDDQRLGDGGVLDLVGVGGGAEPDQVETG